MWCVVGGGTRKSRDKLDDGWWMVEQDCISKS